MITSLNPLLLHLKLDGISDGLVIDASNRGNSAKVQGTPQVVADDTLGACLSLNGKSDYLVLPSGSIPTGDTITVSFWACGGNTLPANCAIIEAVDAHNVPTLSIRVPWGDGTLDFLCGNNGSSNDRLTQTLQVTDYKGAWVHWAFMKDAGNGSMAIYRNGELWLSGTGKTTSLPASKTVQVGALITGRGYYAGKIAQIRIYNQVLSQDEILYTMEADRTALASFRKSFPIDFTLRTGDEEETLPITSDPAGQNLYLEITNASAQTLNLTAPTDPTVSASNYHFALRFRPNTLSPTFISYLSSAVTRISTTQPPPLLSSTALQGIALDTATILQASLSALDWNIGYAQEPAGTVALYFLSNNAQQFTPNAKAIITLPHASASSVSGTHTTRVELLYQQLTSGSDTTPLSGKRQIHLSVVNQSGQQYLPLYAGFVDYDTLLNNGDLNTLNLQLANILPADANAPHKNAIALNTNPNAPSSFFFSFDIQSSTNGWGLATAAQVSAISMQIKSSQAASWSLKSVTLSGQTAPAWQLTPTAAKTELAAGETIAIAISNLISTLPSGFSNLYIHYENMPGYWDGQIVVPLEKSPLLYRGDMVGIGTTMPRNPLTVRASGGNQELVGFQDPANVLKWHINQYFGSKSGLNFVESGVADGRLYLQAGGNVGINTTTPGGLLEIKGENRHVLMTNNQNHGWGLTTWTDDLLYFQYFEQENLQFTAMRLDKGGNLYVDSQVNATGLTIGNMTMKQSAAGNLMLTTSHNVGINTATPSAVLEVTGYNEQFAVTNNQNHTWGLTNWTDDKLYFQYIEQGAFKNNAMYLDKVGTLTVSGISTGGQIQAGSLSMGSMTISTGISFSDSSSKFTVNNGGSYSYVAETGNALKIQAGDGGVLAVKDADVLFWKNGDVFIKGNLWAHNKYFRIDHPARPDHYLLHACLEGPESSVFYRGQAQLHNGRAAIQLPAYFEALTRPENRTVLLTPRGEEPFLLSASEVLDGTFMVYGNKPDGAFAWEVKAIRSDIEMLEPEIRKTNAQY